MRARRSGRVGAQGLWGTQQHEKPGLEEGCGTAEPETSCAASSRPWRTGRSPWGRAWALQDAGPGLAPVTLLSCPLFRSPRRLAVGPVWGRPWLRGWGGQSALGGPQTLQRLFLRLHLCPPTLLAQQPEGLAELLQL